MSESTEAADLIDESPPTLFVPVAFTETEALHLLGAARVVVQSAAMSGKASKAAPLAQAMMRLAEATDKARAA